MDARITAILDALRPLQPERESLIIAIDGRCAAGKTTLAAALQKVVDCQVIHLDDFFLRPEQQSVERRMTPGENVDWERLISDVLQPLCAGEHFTYRPFDCHTQGFKAPVQGSPAALTVIDGTYSCNDHLWPFSDLHIFLTLSPEMQRARILARNGAEGARRFHELWIPLEERYFAASHVAERCALCFDSDGRPCDNKK